MADNGNLNGNGVHDDDAPTMTIGDGHWSISATKTSPPTTDAEIEEAAAVVLESIVEEVVSVIARTPTSDDGYESNASAIVVTEDESKEDDDDLEDFMRKLLLNETGKLVEPAAVVEEVVYGGVGKKADVCLDVEGNYIPPTSSKTPESGSNEASSDRLVEYEDCSASSNKDETEVDNDDPEAVIILIRCLTDENKDLRQKFSKMKRTLAFVMSKYRNSVTFLLNELDLYKRDQKMVQILKEKGQNYDPKMEAYSRNAIIADMKKVMFEAARLDDSTMNLYEERISQLRYENQGLRNIIRISLDYGGQHLLTNVDESTQTYDISKQTVDKDGIETRIAGGYESCDVFNNFYDDEDDMESFHTAGSPDCGSPTPTLRQEPDGVYETSANGGVEPLSPQNGKAGMIGDQDKVVFDADQVNSVLSVVQSKQNNE